jgi:hypothetical protein
MKIIFVHLGEAKASHLALNIIKVKKDFPDLDLVLILDENVEISTTTISGIEIFQYDRNIYKDFQIETLHHDLQFRHGFWRYSIERFLALAAWHTENPSENFIHFESDILIFPNFPFKSFTFSNKLAWLRYNAKNDVAAIFYSPSSVETNWLANQICQRLNEHPDLTDMHLLNAISSRYLERIEILPSLTLFPRLNQLEGISKSADAAFDLLKKYGGVFDGAALGMWLIGQDPRNHLGWIIRYESFVESDVQPADYAFNLNSKKELISRKDNMSVNVFNLHIHSKELRFFDNHWHQSLKSRIEDVHLLKNSRRLSIRTVFELYQEYRKRNRFFSKRTLKRLADLTRNY